ncbi:DMT family transporter [Chthonobacter rhizosphaerae]|uniref:DMT family transporter n=1 Tax=Chthonobacter rhizosphaerae TaxID=2735553 RepID=UPI0015EF6CE2|nr:DMT family transporter [Chthonobacter rhizosphaerae]
MSDYRDTVRGILAMLFCCFSFIVNDTLVKLAGETLPLGQVIFWRGVFSTAMVGAVAWYVGAFRNARSYLSPALGWRVFGEVGATLLYLTALMYIPIAVASTIAQAAPLMITAAGAIFLGERVGWRRWTAVAVGFLGILIIVRPGAESFSIWSLAALASVLLVVVRDVTTRSIPPTTPTLFITTATAFAVMVFGGIMAVPEEWRLMTMRETLLTLGAAVTLIGGFVFIIVATRNGDMSVISPFRYSCILYAIVIGYIVWGDVPDLPTGIGIAVVVGAGVYTFLRERKLHLKTRMAVSAEQGPAGATARPVRETAVG